MSLITGLKQLRYRIFYGLFLRRGYQLTMLGNRHNECCWNFWPAGLNANSIVYSGGVGKDISFEHELVQQFGCKVFLFDPSPTGCETMALPAHQLPQFKFDPVGVAGSCKTLKLAPPVYPEEGSWFKSEGEGKTIEVRCLDLTTLMKQNGHDHIDLLKIDIEGAEYEVLEDLLAKRLPVRQVLVEFHHDILPGFKRSDTIRAIVKMAAAGYKLLDQFGTNHVFLKA